MKKSKDIELLFRTEFESFEVQPSSKVWTRVRSDLFIRNFLHFSPWSLNAWYIGGALILASTLIYILASPPENTVSSPDVSLNMNSGFATDSFSNQSPSITESNLTEPLTIARESKSPNQLLSGTKKSTDQFQSGNKNSENQNPETSKQQAAGNSVSHVSESNANFSGQSVYAWFSCSSNKGCVPLNTSFQNYSQNADRYIWSFGDGGSSDEPSPTYIFDEPGTWFVSLTAFSSKNEISVYTDSIKVYPRPEARFSIETQNKPDDGQLVYFYNYSRGAESYHWDFGDGTSSVLKEPDHYFGKKSGTKINLLVISSNGCVDSTILQDAFKEGEPVFVFPTAFSPNTSGPGSGQYTRKSSDNDVFFPYVEEVPEEYQLKIFNRNGLLIFESNDINTGWDGYYHEELVPQGVYVWKARAKFEDGRSVVRMGDVTVLWDNVY